MSDARRAVALGMAANVALAIVKLVTGLLGHSMALVADAVESGFDLLGSLVVWSGMRIAGRGEDGDYPYGYGKAEPLASAVVALLLIVAAAGIAVEAVDGLRTPHIGPAPYTLWVLAGVIVVKWGIGRRIAAIGARTGSRAAAADAEHHFADALTSGAAFVGIGIAVLAGPSWSTADEWAALFASGVIFINGVRVLRPALDDLMDRAPGPEVAGPIAAAACSVPGVRTIHKLRIRRSGPAYLVDVHVQADPAMSLDAAHRLSGAVKGAIRAAGPRVAAVLVHMEPDDPAEGAARPPSA
jgi:cation diffusion facilitator family transporter